jgi:UDPglucose 6-dehydrogenase
MKIAVAGLWHLGSVTAACLAQAGHDVIGYDADHATIQSLNQNKAPVFEPGLDELIASVQAAGKLSFSSECQALKQADIVWVTFDTPVDDNDIADVAAVTGKVEEFFPYLKNNTLILISSQLPVGTTHKLMIQCTASYPEKNITFAVSPENLRLGKAIQVFTQPDRVVVGVQSEQDKQRVAALLKPITDNIIWMSIESAEMTKHALNAFLATSVVFINELATLCERVGADARDVERGLKSEERIGPKAYLRPGGAIAGGTLARDVNFLVQIGEQQDVNTPLFSSLLQSNQHHKQWSCQRVLNVLKDLRNKTITTLGLTYKAGTDTLRRSTAVETCKWLHEQGARVIAFDPAVRVLPEDLRGVIDLKASLEEALQASDGVVIATEWPEFSALSADKVVNHMREARVFDASGFLIKTLGNDQRIQYFSVGSLS